MTSLQIAVVLFSLASGAAQRATGIPDATQLIGTWRGTSTCTDRVAAPACRDETVVYDFSAGAKPGEVHWKADKIVAGQRELMGEMDLTYDTGDACWKAEFAGPSLKSVWRLTVNGTHLTGTARLLPGNQTVRKIDARLEPSRGRKDDR
jgi:hypothetical protein